MPISSFELHIFCHIQQQLAAISVKQSYHLESFLVRKARENLLVFYQNASCMNLSYCGDTRSNLVYLYNLIYTFSQRGVCHEYFSQIIYFNLISLRELFKTYWILIGFMFSLWKQFRERKDQGQLNLAELLDLLFMFSFTICNSPHAALYYTRRGETD